MIGIGRFGSVVLLTVFSSLLSACQTTDIETAAGAEPTLQQLAELKLIDETPAEGDLKVKRFAADPQGRFAISIGEMDGVDRDQAFRVAEQAYSRFCNQSPRDSNGAGQPGVGKLGTRAPFYSSSQRAYFIYMQCAGVGG